MTSRASEILCSGSMVTGSTIMPLSERFTRSTSSACLSIDMLRWTMPMPPCCARAMARWDSVTVSMAELTTGMFNPMLRVNQVRVSVSAGTTLLREGTSRMSSKVSPSGMVSGIMRGYLKMIQHGRKRAARRASDMLVAMARLTRNLLFSLLLLAPIALSQSVRLYVFDNGVIKGIDPETFQLKKEEITTSDMV